MRKILKTHIVCNIVKALFWFSVLLQQKQEEKNQTKEYQNIWKLPKKQTFSSTIFCNVIKQCIIINMEISTTDSISSTHLNKMNCISNCNHFLCAQWQSQNSKLRVWYLQILGKFLFLTLKMNATVSRNAPKSDLKMYLFLFFYQVSSTVPFTLTDSFTRIYPFPHLLQCLEK